MKFLIENWFLILVIIAAVAVGGYFLYVFIKEFKLVPSYSNLISSSIFSIGLILSFTIEQEESHLKNDENGEIKRLTNKQLQIEETLNKEFYIYITALEKERNALLFEDHSLKELQEMYQRREEYGKI